ncbi:MAG: hypothetical protein AB7U43_08570 [Desulfobacter sp.]
MQALLTPTIGIIAAYVAWQQYRLARQKHDIDIFNRRMQVYKTTVAYLVKSETTHSISEDDFYQWLKDVAEAEFLFGKEILDLVEDIEGTSAEILMHERDNPMIKRGKKGEIISLNFESAKLFNEFTSFRGRSSLLFAPYFQTFLKSNKTRRKLDYQKMLFEEERGLEKARQDFTTHTATGDDIPF